MFLRFRNCLLLSCSWVIVISLSIVTLSVYGNSKIALSSTQLITDLSKPILVRQDSPTVTLRLPANQTTGFSWSLKAYDKDNIHLLANEYVTPSNPKLIGSPGYAEFTLTLLPSAFTSSQRFQLIFVYKRPWENIIGSKKVVILVSQPK